jgi:hypothetical protein
MFLCKHSCCRPEALAEGSLGAYAPRDDMPGRRPERSEKGRRPERSEGCTACARQDGVGNFFEQPQILAMTTLKKCFVQT